MVPFCELCTAVAGVIGMPILRLVLRGLKFAARHRHTRHFAPTRMSYPRIPPEDTCGPLLRPRRRPDT